MKAGAGKNHIIGVVMKYFPEKYILCYNKMSDKALFHMPGTKVIPKYDDDGHEMTIPLQPMINELVREKEKLLEAQSSNNPTANQTNLRIQIQENDDKIKELLDQAEKLIVVDNSVHVMLDTPDDKLIEALMTLISQDTPRDQRYVFADKSASSGLGTKFNRLRGSPCIIQTSNEDSSLVSEYSDLIKKAQQRPGLKELLQLYGQYEAAVRQSREYLSIIRPKMMISTTNSSS
jgi:hypothetical protein